MSRSYRTRPERLIAASRIPRDETGEAQLPTIVSRRPRAGDVHPLKPRVLEECLRTGVPLEYIYGLKRIELCPRPGDIGAPFGSYYPGERRIVLYSLPRTWRLPDLEPSFGLLLSARLCRAEVELEGVEWIVRWKVPGSLSAWFHYEVFCHELGHHFVHQYRHKNRRRGRTSHEEAVAQLRGSRVFHSWVRAVRRRRRRARLSSAPEAR